MQVIRSNLIGLNIFISFYNYTSIQIYMMIIQAMGLERRLKAYKVLLNCILLCFIVTQFLIETKRIVIYTYTDFII